MHYRIGVNILKFKILSHCQKVNFIFTKKKEINENYLSEYLKFEGIRYCIYGVPKHTRYCNTGRLVTSHKYCRHSLNYISTY